ncbi:hypothetical protein [Rubrivivax sp. A210]|uniref:hypothetical protein n=1 Tax=Rubrivivax sp. A210 TaxID=2772301 RepID=UPI00191B1C8E|nr:hypothetical protein [Rubrivivax sp. A210]
MACAFAPPVESQLDVQLLDPISEGQRRTRLKDVVVLCANCHRLAHSVEPLLGVEGLRRVVQAED